MRPLFGIVAATDCAAVPGVSLGQVRLDVEPRRALSPLGRPTDQDGAMGVYSSTWIGKGGGRLDVLVRRLNNGDPDERTAVRLVRATSLSFVLPNGLRTGSSAGDLRRVYPGAKASNSYAASTGRVRIWDDVRRGLAWEATANGRVSALIVHPRGTPVDDTLKRHLTGAL